MIDTDHYIHLKAYLNQIGYGGEIQWAENIKPCVDADAFYQETCWVIINGGMKEQVARIIWNRIKDAWHNGGRAIDVFRHPGKAAAIDAVRDTKTKLFGQYCIASDKFKFLIGIPWIGPITVYHLARNLGIDCVKPDRHLVRIANQSSETPDQLCGRLARATGDRIGVIDCILWRCANLGLI